MNNLFRSERLVYRALDPSAHAEFFYQLRLDGSVGAGLAASTKPIARGDCEKALRDRLDGAILMVAICLPPPGASSRAGLPNGVVTSPSEDEGAAPEQAAVPIGIVNLNGEASVHRNARVAVQIASGYRGRGYGSEAIDWVTAWAFVHGGLHRVGIDAFSYNEGAVRLYGRMGFVREATVKEDVWFDGAWHDIVSFRLLEHEWREREDGRKAGGARQGAL